MDRIGKIIVQEKTYELAWNGGVRVSSPHCMSRKKINTIRIETDIDVWVGKDKVEPKDYVKEVIGRAVKEFLYQDITPFALASSNSRFKLKIQLIDTYDDVIVNPDKGLNAPSVVDAVFSFGDESGKFFCPHCKSEIEASVCGIKYSSSVVAQCPHCEGKIEWRLALGKHISKEEEEDDD